MKKTRRAVSRRLFAVAAAVAAVLTMPGLEICFANPDQFTLTAAGAVALWAAAFLAVTGIAALILLAAKKCRAFPFTACLMTAFSIALILQYRLWSDFFPTDMTNGGLLVDLPLAALHIGVFLLPSAPFLIWRKRLYRHLGGIAAVILLSQIGSTLYPLLDRSRNTGDYDFREYAADESAKFTFGKRDNIIVLVIDCMSESLAKQALRRYPALRELLRDFTAFDRMESPLARTIYAVPAMLTGIEFPARPDGTPADADHAEYLNRSCRNPSSIFAALKRFGYRTEGYPFILQTVSYAPDVLDNSIPIDETIQRESAIKIVDTVLLKIVPFYLRPLLEEYYCIATDPFVTVQTKGKNAAPDEVHDQTFFRRLGAEFKVGDREKVFKYLHLHGAHLELRTGEDLEFTPDPDHLRQLRGSLKNLERLIGKLKETGLYDRATLVVTGDHTENYSPEVITFIKRPGEHHHELTFNAAPARVRDICATILAVVDRKYAPQSLFARPALPGSLAHERTGHLTVLDLSPWQRDERAQAPNAPDCYGPAALLLPDRRLRVEFDATARLRNVRFTVENIDTRARITAHAEPRYGELFAQTAPLELADGIYRVYVETAELDPEERPVETVQFLPQFLECRKGSLAFAAVPHDRPVRPMRQNEKIAFRPLVEYPQLVFPEKWRIAGDVLLLDKPWHLGIRLPRLEHGAVLELEIQPLRIRGILSVGGEGIAPDSVSVDGPDMPVLRLPVLPGEAHILPLRFEFTPRLRRRDMTMPMHTLRIRSVRLAGQE